MKPFYMNDQLFHNRLKVLENTTEVLAKATFNNLHILKSRIIGHYEDLDILDIKFTTPSDSDKPKILLGNNDIQQPSFCKC